MKKGVTQFAAGNYEAAWRAWSMVPEAEISAIPSVAYSMAQAALLASHPQQACPLFRRLGKTTGVWAERAAWRAADCAVALGDAKNAATLYTAALARHHDCSKESDCPDTDVGAVLFRTSELLDQSTASGRGSALRRRIVVEYPLHPLAELAEQKLVAEKASPLTTPERVTRAQKMLTQRAWDRAVSEIAQLPTNPVTAANMQLVYTLGTALYKTRHHYPEAAGRLLSVWNLLNDERQKADALFHGARAQSRADLDDQAIVGYRQVVEKFPRAPWAPEASFLIGWLDFNRQKYDDAVVGFENTLRHYASDARGHWPHNWEVETRWYLALTYWLQGKRGNAAPLFENLRRENDPLIAGKASYFLARSAELDKKTDEAEQLYRGLVTRYPFTYYALLSRVRLQDMGHTVGPWGDRSSTTPVRALDATSATAGLDAFRPADTLLSLSLPWEATRWLHAHEAELVRQLGAPRALPAIFSRYEQGEDFFHLHRLAESWSKGALHQDPWRHEGACSKPSVSKACKNPDAAYWWEKAYPLAYRELIEKYAPSGRNPPYYLYAIMRKESAYNPNDASYADALGLLQMIPPTSRRVAAALRIEYSDDELYDPDMNIRLGAWYIGRLLQKFKGQIALGAGSFNAGPKAMIKWLTRYGDRPLDEFIELCSYTQTREYMKKLLGIYAVYSYLYAKQDYLPSLTVDKTYLDDNIDY